MPRPRRSKSQRIDIDAQRVLHAALDPIALLNEQHNDFGIDFQCELFAGVSGQAHEATGIDFQVQLKGAAGTRGGTAGLAVAIKRDRLEYYVKDKLTPVFLIAINNHTKEGYWLFAQRDLPPLLAASKANKSISISFPESNSIFDHERFVSAVKDAHRYMQSLRPGSVEAATRALKNQIEQTIKLENFSAHSDGNRTHIQLSPKEPFAVQFKIEGPDDKRAAAITDAVGKGLEIDTATYGITVTSAELNRIFGAAGHVARFQLGCQVDGMVRIRRRTEDARTVSQMDFHGLWRGGLKELRLAASAGPHLNVSATAAFSESGTAVSLDLTFIYESWRGQDILTFAYFDRYHNDFAGDESAHTTTVELFFAGESAGESQLDSRCHEHIESIASLIRITKLARDVAKRTNTRVVFPVKGLKPNDWQDVVYAHRFISGHQTVVSVTEWSAEMNVSPAPGPGDAQPVPFEVDAVLELPTEKFRGSVFGTEINFGDVLATATGARLVATPVRADAQGVIVQLRLKHPVNADVTPLKPTDKMSISVFPYLPHAAAAGGTTHPPPN